MATVKSLCTLYCFDSLIQSLREPCQARLLKALKRGSAGTKGVSKFSSIFEVSFKIKENRVGGGSAISFFAWAN